MAAITGQSEREKEGDRWGNESKNQIENFLKNEEDITVGWLHSIYSRPKFFWTHEVRDSFNLVPPLSLLDKCVSETGEGQSDIGFADVNQK